jgi:hypothetical protein
MKLTSSIGQARLLAVAAGLCAVLTPSVSWAVQPSANDADQRLRAAVVYRLARYAGWNAKVFADEKSPVVIGVLGDDAFARTLAEVSNGKTSEGRRFDIRTLKKSADATGCHLLFVSKSEQGNLRKILEDVAKQPLVTVSDMEGFTRSGGMVQFWVSRGMPRFEVNLGAAKAAGVTLSSRFLRFSRIVGTNNFKER